MGKCDLKIECLRKKTLYACKEQVFAATLTVFVVFDITDANWVSFDFNVSYSSC